MRFPAWAALPLLFLFSTMTMAATYNFDGSSNVSGCTRSGASYTCGSNPATQGNDAIVIGNGVSVTVNSSVSLSYNQGLTMSGTAKLTTNGNLSIADVRPGNLQISGGTLAAIGGSFAMGNQSQSITCDIVASGVATIGSGSTVVLNGSIKAGGAVTLGSNTTVNGDIAGTAVTLSSANSHVVGNVNASSSVTIGSNCDVTGNVTAPAITLRATSAKIKGTATTASLMSEWNTCVYALSCTQGGTACVAPSSWKPWPICDDAPPVPSGPGGFNAYETATPANAATGVIQTKTAGSLFNLDLVALDTAKSAILTSFTGAVKVELLDASGGGALDSNACNASWPLIQTLAANPVFAAADKGRKTVSFQVGDAWRNVAVRITYPATGATSAVGCSSDHFAIRPAVLDVAASDTDWQSAGTVRLLNNDPATGNIHKAGQPFTITAVARNGSGAVTPGYSGSPAASVQSCLPAGCVAGTVSASGWSGSGTVAAIAKYSEVGVFHLLLQDSDFAAVDAADTPATCAGRYVCAVAVPVGRFVPDRFDLSAAALIDRADLSCAPASPFTYMDEPLRANFTLTAKNADGAVTRNYHGGLGLAKLDLSLPEALDLGAASVAAGGAVTRRSDRVPLGLQTSSGSWINGVANVTIGFLFARDPDPDGPFTVGFGIAPRDEDGVTLSVYDMDIDPPSPTPDHARLGETSIRFGRLKLSNAFGSEQLDLPVPVEAQYWNGFAFITNAADECTTISTDHVAVAGSVLPGQLAGLGTLQQGKTSLVLKQPLTAGGSADLAIRLANGTAADRSCPSPLGSVGEGAALEYLRGRWCGAGYDRDPRARVGFGVYKNPGQTIYLREMY